MAILPVKMGKILTNCIFTRILGKNAKKFPFHPHFNEKHKNIPKILLF
jgi:hypothetical protein